MDENKAISTILVTMNRNGGSLRTLRQFGVDLVVEKIEKPEGSVFFLVKAQGQVNDALLEQIKKFLRGE